MCSKAVRIKSCTLKYIPDHLKTQEVCNEAVHIKPYTLKYIPDHLKTQEMCIKAVEVDPWALEHVPTSLITQKMCDAAVSEGSYSLQYVLDWFVMQDQVKIWHDDNDYCDDDEIAEWYDEYKKRKTQKTQIKKELMPIAWHPSRWWNWCMPENDKKETEKMWLQLGEYQIVVLTI